MEIEAIIDKKNRADIIDRNGNYLVKTVSSINIGINPVEVIDKKKLIINLKLIFPNKNYSEIKKNLIRINFFILKKKYQLKITKRLCCLGISPLNQRKN